MGYCLGGVDCIDFTFSELKKKKKERTLFLPFLKSLQNYILKVIYSWLGIFCHAFCSICEWYMLPNKCCLVHSGAEFWQEHEFFISCSKGKRKKPKLLRLLDLLLTVSAVVPTFAKIDTGKNMNWHFWAILFLLRIWKCDTWTLLSSLKYSSCWSLLKVVPFSVFLRS